jgi:formate dehydrogenase iron-sulfur subunit
MTLRFYIPIDEGALAVGAGQVGSATQTAAARQNVAIEVVRTARAGFYWFEPIDPFPRRFRRPGALASS